MYREEWWISYWIWIFVFSLSLSLSPVCICVYVGWHGARVAAEQKVFCRDCDSEAANALMLKHILAFFKDFFSPLPTLRPSPYSALLLKACLKCLIILCKLTDQGNILRGSSWAHHFVWGDFRLLSSSLSAHTLASLSFFFACSFWSLTCTFSRSLPLSHVSHLQSNEC